MEKYLYNQVGSVDDVRCSLGHINPETLDQALDHERTLLESLENELANSNRATVIKMLESKYKYIQKRIQSWKTR